MQLLIQSRNSSGWFVRSLLSIGGEGGQINQYIILYTLLQHKQNQVKYVEQYYYWYIASNGQYWSRTVVSISITSFIVCFNLPERLNDSDVQNLPNDK